MSVQRYKIRLILSYSDAKVWHTRFAITIEKAEKLMVGMVGDFVNGTDTVIARYKGDNRVEDAAGIKRGDFNVVAAIIDTLEPEERIVTTLDAGAFIRHHTTEPITVGKDYPCGCLQMFDREKGERWKKCGTADCFVFVPDVDRVAWLKPSRRWG